MSEGDDLAIVSPARIGIVPPSAGPIEAGEA